MAKDNHLAILAANDKVNLSEALQSMSAFLPHTPHIEVEVDHPDQIEAVLAGGADTILLDNFTTAQLHSRLLKSQAARWSKPAVASRWPAFPRSPPPA